MYWDNWSLITPSSTYNVFIRSQHLNPTHLEIGADNRCQGWESVISALYDHSKKECTRQKKHKSEENTQHTRKESAEKTPLTLTGGVGWGQRGGRVGADFSRGLVRLLNRQDRGV